MHGRQGYRSWRPGLVIHRNRLIGLEKVWQGRSTKRAVRQMAARVSRVSSPSSPPTPPPIQQTASQPAGSSAPSGGPPSSQPAATPAPPPPKPSLADAEISALTRVPLATLRYWRHIGKGPRSFKLGGRVADKRGDVEAWVEAQYNAADGQPGSQ
jgi:hypothetical protein